MRKAADPGVGIDVVDLARIARSAQRSPGALATRLLDDGERAWVDAGAAPQVRLAACFALKEAAIKARGGRPRPFRWIDLAHRPAEGGPAWMAEALAALGTNGVEWATVAGGPAAWGVAETMVVAVTAAGADAIRVVTARVPVDGARAASLTAKERAYCGPSAARRAGRVAAKAAVRELLALGDDGPVIEVMPGAHPADDPQPCRGGHPPRVVVGGRAGSVRVTISHGRSAAVALAWRPPTRT